MYISDDELVESKIHLKTWLSQLQVKGKEAGAPSFALSGPVSLPVRRRRASPRPGEPAMVSGNFPFMGGEKFKLSGASQERDRSQNGQVISLLMTPATTDLAAQGISGMTIPLADALANFDGLEDFVNSVKKDSVGVTPGLVHSGAPKPKVITKEAISEKWGAW